MGQIIVLADIGATENKVRTRFGAGIFFTQKCNFALVFGTVDRLSSNLWGGFIEFLVNKSLTATHIRLFLPRYENFFDYIYLGDTVTSKLKTANLRLYI